jgi:hypothetical protein
MYYKLALLVSQYLVSLTVEVSKLLCKGYIMSDANFINAYNEVILENLNAIMKQNFMFQTQIKFLEEQKALFAQGLKTVK